MRLSTPKTLIVGVKGVQYGLQNQEERPKPKKTNLFSVDDDDELNVNKRVREESNRKKQKDKEMLKKALEEDPMAFAYDEVYSEMKKTSKSQEVTSLKREPKYIHGLIKGAEEREKMNNLVFQRQLQRELEEDKKLYGEQTEEFITPAYKRQLEENKKYEAELRLKEAEEERKSVSKVGMNSFYLNVLDQRNVAFGGVEESGGGVKRSRSATQEEDEEDDEDEERTRERDRVKRLRIRAERDQEEADRLKQERERKQAEQIKTLQDQYAKHQTSSEEVRAARLRYLERKKAT